MKTDATTTVHIVDEWITHLKDLATLFVKRTLFGFGDLRNFLNNLRIYFFHKQHIL